MKTDLLKSLLRLDDIAKYGGKKLALRYLFSTLGVIIIGLGCGVVVEMAVGCDTYTCFNRSIWYILTDIFGEFPFGHVNLAVNLIIFVFMLFIKRDLIGFGTLFNMVSVGYIIDIVHKLFDTAGISGSELGIALRIVLICIALPVIGFGDALYFEADIGVSPYDAIAFMLEKTTGGRVSFKALRTGSDCFFLAAGFCLGLLTGKQWELANVGTLLLATCTGMMIVFWRKYVTSKMI